MPRVARRRFLQATGAGAAAAQTGGIAGLLATARAPAYAQQTTLHSLRWNEFVPASDQRLMYANAIRGLAPEEAVKWAHGELTKIYA
jgi:hypothetical protein